MLGVYILSAVFGGTLLLLSALGAGGDDADGPDIDGELDFEVDADAHVDLAIEAHTGTDLVIDHDVDGADLSSWLPFFSLRFWIYFAATFGLTGTLITSLEMASVAIAGALSVGAGLVAGTGMVNVVRALKKGEARSLEAIDFESSEATVSTTIRKGELGKVRTRVRGEWVDLLAETTENDPIEPGTVVLIVEMRGTNAVVVRSETIFE